MGNKVVGEVIDRGDGLYEINQYLYRAEKVLDTDGEFIFVPVSPEEMFLEEES
jgi:hypothetical protein